MQIDSLSSNYISLKYNLNANNCGKREIQLFFIIFVFINFNPPNFSTGSKGSYIGSIKYLPT